MKKCDFNEYAEDYEKLLHNNLKFGGKDVSYYAEHKAITIKENIIQTPCNILEYGCGIGRNLSYLKYYFPQASITACDLSEESISMAQKKNADVNFFAINENNLIQHERQYDFILMAGVMHHVVLEERATVANNFLRLLKPSGELIIFEHNPYNPLTCHAVNTCEWDKDAILLKPRETSNLLKNAGFKILSQNYTLFFPAKFKIFQPIEKFISWLPLGGQYFMHCKVA